MREDRGRQREGETGKERRKRGDSDRKRGKEGGREGGWGGREREWEKSGRDRRRETERGGNWVRGETGKRMREAIGKKERGSKRARKRGRDKKMWGRRGEKK